jgi:hypothetical protein
MEKKLKEEISKIHKIIYSEKLITEENEFSDFLKKIWQSLKSGYNDLTNTEEKTDDFIERLEKLQPPITNKDDIKLIQAALVLLNYSLPNYGIDGIIGNETKKAIENFKKENYEKA